MVVTPMPLRAQRVGWCARRIALVGALALAGCSQCGDSPAKQAAAPSAVRGAEAIAAEAKKGPAGAGSRPPPAPEPPKPPPPAAPAKPATPTALKGVVTPASAGYLGKVPAESEGAATVEEAARALVGAAPEKVVLSRKDIEALFLREAQAQRLLAIAHVFEGPRKAPPRPWKIEVLKFVPGKESTLAAGTDGLKDATPAVVGAELEIMMNGEMQGIPLAPFLRVGDRWKSTGIR